MSSPARIFGDRIRRERLAHGWTQEHLASLVGANIMTISRLERGRQNVTIDMLALVVKALGFELTIAVPEKDRIDVSLHPAALKALDRLAARGLHGIGRDGVAQRMIEDGLRRADGERGRVG